MRALRERDLTELLLLSQRFPSLIQLFRRGFSQAMLIEYSSEVGPLNSNTDFKPLADRLFAELAETATTALAVLQPIKVELDNFERPPFEVQLPNGSGESREFICRSFALFLFSSISFFLSFKSEILILKHIQRKRKNIFHKNWLI